MAHTGNKTDSGTLESDCVEFKEMNTKNYNHLWLSLVRNGGLTTEIDSDD